MTRASWSRWRWEWRWRDGGIDVDLTMLNRPYVDWYWHGNERGSLSFAYGNGNSDPIFTIWTPEFAPPRLLVRWLEKHGCPW